MLNQIVSLFPRSILAGVVLGLLLPTGSHAATLKIGGTGAALGTMKILADAFMRKHPDVSIEVPGSLGSRGGIKAVIAGALDIGLSSRPLKTRERNAGVAEIHYATTPFVLVSSLGNSNPVPSLSSQELVRIFSGAPALWDDGTPVRIILRNRKDTSTKILISAFEGMDIALASARAIPGITVAPTEQDNMDLAERMPGALTTSSLTLVLAERRSVTPIAIDGVAPTVENLANGSYRLIKNFYLVTGPKVSRLALQFIRFVRSAKGTAILKATGNLAATDD
jgi:phosphate transport system substrate-binding protein